MKVVMKKKRTDDKKMLHPTQPICPGPTDPTRPFFMRFLEPLPLPRITGQADSQAPPRR